MRALLIALFATGIVFVLLNEQLRTARASDTVEYRYLPRDLDTYLRELPYATVQYKDMFDR